MSCQPDYIYVKENALTKEQCKSIIHLLDNSELILGKFYHTEPGQFHPEFKSRPGKSHPLFKGFMLAVKQFACQSV